MACLSLGRRYAHGACALVATAWLAATGAAACGPESFQRDRLDARADRAQDGALDEAGDGSAGADLASEGGGGSGGDGGAAGGGGAGGSGGTSGAGGGGAGGAGGGPPVFDGGVDGPRCIGGASGSDPDAGVPTHPPFVTSWSFDTSSLSGWSLVGQPADVLAASRFAYDPSEGFPARGSARVAVPFNGNYQQIGFEYNLPTPANYAGKMMVGWVRMNTCNPATTVEVGLVCKTQLGVHLYASGHTQFITAEDGWVLLTLDFDAPEFVDMGRRDADGGMYRHDPTMVAQVTVIVQSRNIPYLDTEISVDSLGIYDKPRPDGGADAGPDAGSASDARADTPAGN